MSRQGDYQRRHAKQGLCHLCSNKQAPNSTRCRTCTKKRREKTGHKAWKKGNRGRPPNGVKS